MREAPSTDEPEPTDGRKLGEWKSRYPDEAWRRIWFELGYLIILLLAGSVLLIAIGNALASVRPGTPPILVTLCGVTVEREILSWLSVAIAGMIGGVAFDLKWLYHSVAKHIWSVDRCLWRLIVPLVSGVVAVFLAFMIVSGIVPFLKGDSFKNMYFGLGFGFLFGYFSDNVLAALKKFADTAFGRTNPQGHPDQPDR